MQTEDYHHVASTNIMIRGSASNAILDAKLVMMEETMTSVFRALLALNCFNQLSLGDQNVAFRIVALVINTIHA